MIQSGALYCAIQPVQLPLGVLAEAIEVAESGVGESDEEVGPANRDFAVRPRITTTASWRKKWPFTAHQLLIKVSVSAGRNDSTQATSRPTDTAAAFFR